METIAIKQPVKYLPYEERAPNPEYYNLLKTVMEKGEEKYSPHHGQKKRRISGYLMRFIMNQGFPLITERRISEKQMKGAIGEIIGFSNGARTIQELEKYGCPSYFWEKWVTAERCAKFGLEPGDLGPASYGPAWTKFPTPDGRTFNQVENLQRQLKMDPNIRTQYLMPLIPFATCTDHPDFKRDVVVAPCHGYVQIDADKETRTMRLMHVQASADVPVGLPNNMAEYGALGMMYASVIGYEFTEYVHFLLDAHIYECQYPAVEIMLKREPRKLPTVTMQNMKIRVEDYRPDDFLRADYDPHPKIEIPTPV